MKKRIIAIVICFAIFILSPCAYADSLTSDCQYFLRFLSNAVNLYSEYTIDTMLLYETDEVRAYNMDMISEEDEYNAQIIFNKTKDGKNVSGYTVSFYIEDYLYDNGERFEQITNVILCTLKTFMDSEKTTQAFSNFRERLNNYFFEESHRSYNYKQNGVTLTLDYLNENYMVLVTLD